MAHQHFDIEALRTAGQALEQDILKAAQSEPDANMAEMMHCVAALANWRMGYHPCVAQLLNDGRSTDKIVYAMAKTLGDIISEVLQGLHSSQHQNFITAIETSANYNADNATFIKVNPMQGGTA